MTKKISLFIPVYNCKEQIKPNIEQSVKTLINSNFPFEVYIVDDNSTDKSNELANEIEKMSQGGKYSIRYLFYCSGPSRRENLAKSFALASGDIICFIDSDFSCDMSFLLRAIETLDDNMVDIVIGSRYVKGAKAKRRFLRRVFSFFIT